MGLAGAGRPADAVATGAAAEKHDLVTGVRALAAHVGRRGGADDGADLHALGDVAGVVELGDLPRCEADLVAVGGVACGCRPHELALRELAGERLRDGHRGIGRAGHAHGLVDVAAARERVADGAADAGGRAAEGLDLGGVVVGLVLEEVEPVLVVAVHVDLHLDGAGVDLLGLVEVLEDALGLEPLGTDRAHVHEGDRTVVAGELVTHAEVLLEGRCDRGVVDLQVLEVGAEGRVAAVVRPVGVDHLDLGDRGHPALGGEVALAEGDVGEVHGQAAVVDEGLELRLVEVEEAVEGLDHGGLGIARPEGLAGGEGGLAGLDRVDHVALDRLDVLVRELALEDVDLRGTDRRPLALADELDALARRVGALVKLAGQRLDREDDVAVGDRGHLAGGVVGLGLGEDGGHAGVKELLGDALHVVAVDEPQVGEAFDAEHVPQLVREGLGLPVEAVLLLNKDARNHCILPFVCG